MTDRLIGREIVVPGSIGNLGPGFDTVALALAVYFRVRIVGVARDGRGRLDCRFLDRAPLGRNRLAQAFSFGDGAAGGASLTVDVRSDIPQRAGLGSSAAATIAGLRLQALVRGRRRPEALLGDAAAIEGHPDNAAASLYGGLTTSLVRADGAVDVDRWIWPSGWRLVVATPECELATATSRRALPARIPIGDAVFNFQRLARLLAAVRDRDASRVRDAFADRSHQPYRAKLVPHLRDALDLQHPDLLGVCLSGAGPSVVGITRRKTSGVAQAMAAVYHRTRTPVTIRILKVHPE